MFVARLICSDAGCASGHEVEAPTLAELEALACDCGCVLEVIAWPDWMEPRRSVIISLAPQAVGEPGAGRVRAAA